MPRCGRGARSSWSECASAARSHTDGAIPGTSLAAPRDMLKPWLIPLAMTMACATSEKPGVPGGSAISATSKPESPPDAAFAASKDGTPIAFEKTGAGPALVIVGGALSHRKGSKPLAAKLAERFAVYTYDRRGRGQSGDTKPYAVEREIEDLGAIIAQAGNQAYVY